MEKALIALVCAYYLGIVVFGYYMFTRRKKAVIEGRVSAKHFKGYAGESPEDLKVLQNHFNNQFQIPMVFFFAVLLNLQQDTVNEWTLALAVLFVASRAGHTIVHLGSNRLIRRASLYFLGVLTVGAMLFMPLLN